MLKAYKFRLYPTKSP
ncbi:MULTISPECIES: helix-turn-helix domain-containing protein [Methanothrix]|uniref:Helix-turn-helix domain-containing protein n=1 Tax=Methanothrix soehngenii TaxID=2223 RepID=A0A7K4AGZ5_METSH|nr:helix-turn-helix domain-containing protein [Methanothrix sp.]MBP7068801.1 helix-turn-helix domain-containing protein [Methanothrix sp.]MBP7069426.1 helix-turn-helix domain-containing protein [Methanothrix sp.]NLJ22256.1 helix-turn-helix domain-containing protein [Methanothrix soehngenii]NYT10653.1 helix-turn-helix domain-containing protein [Methanosarcinales archaeon]